MGRNFDGIDIFFIVTIAIYLIVLTAFIVTFCLEMKKNKIDLNDNVEKEEPKKKTTKSKDIVKVQMSESKVVIPEEKVKVSNSNKKNTKNSKKKITKNVKVKKTNSKQKKNTKTKKKSKKTK